MKGLRDLFGQAWLLGLIVVVLLSLLIWFGGPWLAIADRKPFESVTGRLIGLLVLVIGWALYNQIRLLRAARSGDGLASAVARQQDAAAVPAQAAAAAPDAAQLRERFDRAVTALRKSKRSQNLYALPWYIIIGPPGSGKTTALLNSGLRFPLEKEVGRDPVRGVGGTRNCDWWITDEAILLDTAGRFVTQDSNQIADRAGWLEFMSLLKKHRKRRPINGVLLTMSVADLLQGSAEDRERAALAVRRRLEELREQLGISFPVYVLWTKADLIAGFAEFFDDLNQAGRNQVWGVTFPIDASRDGRALQMLSTEFDLLVTRLQERSLERMAEERDLTRRAAIQAFPGQVAGLKRVTSEFLDDVLRGSSLGRDVWIRGCYFTSGTQEGTPIDRMMGAMARLYGLGVSSQSASGARGKSYFLQQLLQQVVLGESGLAGVNRAAELKRAGLQVAGYVGVAAAIVAGLGVLFWSQRANQAFIAEVAQLAQQVLPAAAQASAGTNGLSDALPRLDALRLVGDATRRHDAEGVPLSMRWGLYQGERMTELADDAYRRELNAVLRPWAGEQLASRLQALAAEPDQLYGVLMSYLMLAEPKRIEPRQLALTGAEEWRRVLSADPAVAERVVQHFTSWVALPDRVQPIDANAQVIEQARLSLEQASLPLLMYNRLRFDYAGIEDGALRLDQQLTTGGDAVLARKSGRPLSEPLSALYTRAAFDDYQRTGRLKLTQRFLEEAWVFGDRAPSLTATPALEGQVLRLYEADYIRAWDDLLADLTLRAARDAQDLSTMLGLLASPSSPLKRLMVIVEQQTNLLKPAEGAAGQASAAIAAGADALAGGVAQVAALAGGPAPTSARPGAAVTAHFQAYHQLVAGAPGPTPIDATLAQLASVKQQLDAAARGGAGGAGAVAQALAQLDIVAAQLPGPVAQVVKTAGQSSASEALGGARTELANRYVNEVVRECRDLLGNRYPMNRASAAEVTPADFGRVLGPGGVYDAFFQMQLLPLVDTSTRSWRWKEESQGVAALPLAPFQRAQEIRNALFRPGSGSPEVQVTLTPEYLDAEVNRLVVTIDGQTLEYSHGPQRSVSVAWPAAMATGVTIVFEDKSGARPNLAFPGAWGLFRMFDAADVQKVSDTRFVLTLSAGGRTARLGLSAGSVRNPFARGELMRFRCG
jgi:type VI secretion system protein ImpL